MGLDDLTIRGRELQSSLTPQERHRDPPSLCGRSLALYISFLGHSHSTLVSHPYAYLSARPISHCF